MRHDEHNAPSNWATPNPFRDEEKEALEQKLWVDTALGKKVDLSDHPDFATRQSEAQARKDRLAKLDAEYSLLDRMDGVGGDPISVEPRRWEWAVVALFIVVLLAIALFAASMVLWPKGAAAEPYTTTDQAFLEVMHAEGLEARSDAETLAAAHEVCAQLDGNNGNVEKTIMWLYGVSQFTDVGSASYFVGGSIAAYCDQYSTSGNIVATPAPKRIGGALY
jgi:hypothetical protein